MRTLIAMTATVLAALAVAPAQADSGCRNAVGYMMVKTSAVAPDPATIQYLQETLCKFREDKINVTEGLLTDQGLKDAFTAIVSNNCGWREYSAGIATGVLLGGLAGWSGTAGMIEVRAGQTLEQAMAMGSTVGYSKALTMPAGAAAIAGSAAVFGLFGAGGVGVYCATRA